MPEAQKAAPQLTKDNLALLESISTRFDAMIPLGVPPEALIEEGFWAHVATKLRPYNEIRARAEDGTWVGYYIVLDSSRTWARVKCLSMHQLTTADVALTQASQDQVTAFIADHDVVWKGPSAKYAIVRKSDKAMIHSGCQEKDAAHAWLSAHARASIAAPAVQKNSAVAA